VKILMFGRGVIASIYGRALEQAGHTVEFYVRPGRASQYGPILSMEVLDARSSSEGILRKEVWPVTLREDLPADHDFDLIVVSVRHNQFAEAAKFLGPRVGNATVLVFGNLWSEPQETASPIPSDRLAWGFCGAGGGFDDTGKLTGGMLRPIQFGTFGADPSPRELAVREVFRNAGFAVNEHRDWRAWLWIHFITDVGFTGRVLETGSAQLNDPPEDLKQVVLNTRELLPLLAARGIDLKKHSSELLAFRVPLWLIGLAGRVAPRLKAAKPILFILSTLAGGEGDESKSINVDALAEARRLGVSVPRLESRERLFNPAL
jgi:2-dehydropantoate 2-reductase